MPNLSPTLNPITREERLKVNENWDKITLRFSQLQSQLSFLSGSVEVEDLINQINQATQLATEAQQAAIVATNNAEIATNNTIVAISNTEQSTANANLQADRAKEQADYISERQNTIDFFISMQTNLQQQINQLVIDGDSSPEAAQARVNALGVTYPSLKSRLDDENTKITNQLIESDKQTSTLSQGLSVVTASNNTLAEIEIEGRTLVNLLGRLGRTSTSATIIVESNKYYVFVSRNQATNAVTFTKHTGVTSLVLNWPIGNYGSLYEVDQVNYARIGVDFDSFAVGLRYPYVDDIKHLQGVGVIAEGENLLEQTDEAINKYVFGMTEKRSKFRTLDEFDVFVDSTLSVGHGYIIDTVVGQTYTLSWEGTSNRIQVRAGNASPFNQYISFEGGLGVNTRTFRALTATTHIVFAIWGGTSNTQPASYKNVMLNLGSVAKPYVRYNKSYVYSDVKLGEIGTNRDVLYQQEGRWLMRKVLDKDVALTISSRVAILTNNAVASTAVISDSSNGAVFNRVAALTGSGNEFVQGGANNKTITFNASNLPTTPIAQYALDITQTIDVTDKVEGILKINGLTQVSVDSGYRRTVVDGKTTWSRGSKIDYTANPTNVKLTYANNIRNALDDTVTKVQDNATLLSVHERAIVDLYVRLRALGG